MKIYMAKHNKKGDLSINIIIIAAISLAVLVILFMIFTGRLNLFSKGVTQTQKAGYTCICNNPTDDVEEVCTASAPVGYSEKPKEAACGNRWTDCIEPLNCYKK